MSSLASLQAAVERASAILRLAAVVTERTDPEINSLEMSFDDFEHWHQVTCRSHSLTNCRFDVQAPFRAKLQSRDLGEFVAGTTSTSSFTSITSRRGLAETSKDSVDDFMALQIVEGTVQFAQAGRHLVGASGDVFLYDQSRPFALDIIGRHHLAFLAVPRAAMVERLADAEHATACVLPSGSKVGELARAVLRFASTVEGLDAPATGRVARAALDILAAAFDPRLADRQPGGGHRLLAAAKAYMLAHLAENALDVGTVADALGVAPRTVTRIFATEGVTPMRWLWRQRLDAAHGRLLRRHFGTVTEVAMQCGFADLPHFSRLFKKTYGTSPSDLPR